MQRYIKLYLCILYIKIFYLKRLTYLFFKKNIDGSQLRAIAFFVVILYTLLRSKRNLIKVLSSFSICYFKKNHILSYPKPSENSPSLVYKTEQLIYNKYNTLKVFVFSSIFILTKEIYHSLNMNAAHFSNRNIVFYNFDCTCLNFSTHKYRHQ